MRFLATGGKVTFLRFCCPPLPTQVLLRDSVHLCQVGKVRCTEALGHRQ